MLHLTPFLLFDGNCAEAMEFYRSSFGGDLAVTRVGEMPTREQFPTEQYQKVTYAHLKSDAIEFSATDWLHPTRKPYQGNTVAMYITGGAYSELRAIFDRLSVGADEALLDDLRDMPFGSYGHLADQFGIHWFFQGERSPGA